jgi:hypothetical protein
MFKLGGGLSEDFSCLNDNATGPLSEVISPRAFNQQTVANKPVNRCALLAGEHHHQGGAPGHVNHE